MSLERGSLVMFRGAPAEVVGSTNLVRGGVVVRPLIARGRHALDYVVSQADLLSGEGAAAEHRPSLRPAMTMASEPPKSERPAEPPRKKSKTHHGSKHRSEAKRHESKSHRSKSKTKSHKAKPHTSHRSEASIAREIERLSKRFDKADARKEKKMSKHENLTADQRLILLNGGAMSLGEFNSTSASASGATNDGRALRKFQARHARELAKAARTADATSRPALEQAAARALRIANGESW